MFCIHDKNSADKPLIVIEAKKKGERLDVALEQGIHYAKQLEAPIVFATDGLFCKSFHTKFDRTPILNGEEVDEFLREALALKYLASWEVNTVSPKVQYDRKELIRIFDEANNMLRGDGLRAGIERFGEFANILFLKLISETEQIKKESGEPSSFDSACHWDVIKSIPVSRRIDYINSVYKTLNGSYQTEIFTPLTIRSENILKEIMDKLDPLMLTDVDSDVKGDAFEYFLKESAATKNDLGEYFTPRHIVKTMVKLVNPQIGEKIYDPFCGTGGFLIESFRHIWNTMARNNENKTKLKEKTIYGNEITNTARITKMNMILAGDGHSNIHMQDSLANPVDGMKNEGYDIVITNMPYSQKTKYGSLYDLPSNNGDSICVQHCMKAINVTAENGRIALVVPEGFLFRKDLAKTRELLLKTSNLQSVISLPQGVFLPYTGVKTDIIYATKVNQKLKAPEKRKDFWYFEVKNDGYSLDNHRRKLDVGSDLEKPQEYRKLDEDQRQEMMDVGFEAILIDKVKDNAYILVGSRYRKTQPQTYKYEPMSISALCTSAIGGGTPSTQNSDYWMGSIPWITSADIDDSGKITVRKYISAEGLANSTSNVIPKGNVIVVSRVGLGKAAVNTVDIAISQDLQGLIIDKNKVLPAFFVAMYTKLVDTIKEKAQGSTIKGITRDELLSLVIPIPALEIQQQIVDELDSYQRVIDGARAVVANYKPAIPGNIEGEHRLLKNIAILRPPKDEVKSLADDTLVSFVPMADLNAHNIFFSPKEEKPLREVTSGFTFFKDNDVLLAKITPCFENGKAGIARNLTNGVGFGSTEYIVIRANHDVVYPEWIFYHINSMGFINQGKGHMTGTAGQRRVNIDYVQNYVLVVPNLEEQRRILDEIESERLLIESSKQLIDVFTKKIQNKISEIWG